MSATHWAESYILAGIRWRFGADDAAAGEYDCWNFVRRVQREQFSRDLPLIDLGGNPVPGMLDASRHHQWVRVPDGWQFAEGDIIVMRRPDDLHVGVWAECEGGGVIHCNSTSGGVAWTSRRRLHEMWPVVEGWAHE